METVELNRVNKHNYEVFSGKNSCDVMTGLVMSVATLKNVKFLVLAYVVVNDK